MAGPLPQKGIKFNTVFKVKCRVDYELPNKGRREGECKKKICKSKLKFEI